MRKFAVGRWALCVAIAAGALAGFSPGGQKEAPPSTSAVRASNNLNDVISTEMLGAQISYFERKAGGPYHVSGSTRTYKIRGCLIEVEADKENNISSIALTNVSDKCTFDIGPFIGTKDVQANTLTFAQAEKLAGPGTFFADCLSSCGNAADPSVFETIEGAHSIQFLQLQLTATLVSDAAIDASEKWAKAMSGEGGDYVTETRFNCDHKYNHAARALFANIRITAIALGHNLKSPLPPMECKAN